MRPPTFNASYNERDIFSEFLKQVQHPGAEELMMTDIRNLRTFAAFLQRFDLKFDLLSVIDELEEQVYSLIISMHFCFFVLFYYQGVSAYLGAEPVKWVWLTS